MSIFHALLLGLVQGFTEFLPVSSSGHLALLQNFFGYQVNNELILFDVFVHLGTLLAVIFYFRKELLSITFHKISLIAVGTVPVVFIGLLLKDYVEVFLGIPMAVGFFLLITGVVNLITDRKLAAQSENEEKRLTVKRAFITGLFQAFAILPGISRSGSTLAGSVWQGVGRKEAFSFAFLLSIPAILGATALEVKDILEGQLPAIEMSVFAAGFLAAFLGGMLSLGILKKLIDSAKLEWFGYYCLTLGTLVLLAGFFWIL